MFKTTEYDVFLIKRAALIRTAKHLNILNYDLKDNEELYKEIKEENVQSFNMVKDFIDAYESWFKFHQKLEKQGLKINSGDSNDIALQKHIETKESTRNKLINFLK